MRAFRAIIIFLVMLSFNEFAFAFLSSDFDINLGQSSFQAKFQANNQDQTKTIDSISAVEMNYNLRQSSTGLTYTMSFFELANSKDGYLTFTRFSAGFRWYPLGMNGGRIILDNNVTAKIWKATPFIGASLGLANMSTTSFNASFTDLTPRFGVELPLTNKVLLLGQFVLASSLTSDAGAGAKAITYQGESALIGVVVTNFFD